MHRYSRSQDFDSETEYVMWYHGRTKEMNEDSSLPPLSTGRIGRATSRNGLHWEKDRKGSASEDISGVALGLNQESWWGFDTTHVGLGNVLLPRAEDGIYIMYYMGGNAEETPVGDYTDKELPAELQDVKMKGMKMRIGAAVSQDGVIWGRVEGDDPTNACIGPSDSSDPNTLPTDTVEEELYCAWPEVFNREGKDSFVMLYSTMAKKGKEKCLACAVSPDGFAWTKQGVCLKPGEKVSDDGIDDAAGCARCCVLRNGGYNEQDGSWKDLDGFKMFYEGVSSKDGKHRIMVAESNDGISWTKQGLVLDVGSESENMWDCGGVGAPHVVRMDDGALRMYYTGQSSDGSTAIGVAKLRQGEDQWVREQATFSFMSES